MGTRWTPPSGKIRAELIDYATDEEAQECEENCH